MIIKCSHIDYSFESDYHIDNIDLKWKNAMYGDAI